MSSFKVINIFGEQEIRIVGKANKKANLFSDYDAFTEKFEPKKTTDDCYTPEAVYEIILDYVRKNCNIEGCEIYRPFYPGGDFEAIDYPENCVVIDNPPFSIISKICRFYISKGVKFFLFAPHLTLFGSDIDCTHIVAGAEIIYENGAIVKTSFLSNLFSKVKIIGEPEIYFKIKELNKKPQLPKYEYPLNVLTVSHVAYMVEKGVSIKIDKKSVKHCRQLDSQKAHGKLLFGSGFLISEKAAAQKAAAQKAAAQKAAAQKAAAEKAAAQKAAAEKAAAEKVNIITWELSEKEKAIIAALE